MKKKKIIILFFIGLIIGFLFYYFKNSSYFQIDTIKTFVESLGFWAPLVFALIYIIITIIGISAAALTILAGIIFGVWNGLIIVVVAATISAIIAFYIARTLKKKFFNKEKAHSKIIKKLTNRIENTCEKNGFTTIAILRLSFMPYIPLSYAAGIVEKLKAKDFIFATFLTNIFGSFVFIYLGNSITESIPIFLGAILLFVLFMQIPKLINKFYKKKKNCKI